MKGFRDLALASITALACALVAEFVPVTPLRTIAALVLALVLPGYAITAAAFARSPLGGPQRLVLTVGTSLACLPLAALLLNIIPSGLTTRSWAILLVVVVLAACYLAAFLRPAQAQIPRRVLRPRARDAILLAFAAALFAGAIVLAQTPLPAKHAEGYAALWMVPSGPGASAVEVGVLSNQQKETAYRLQVSEDGGSTTSRSFRLAPGQQEVFVVQVAGATGGRSHVTAKLFRSPERTDVYRQVNIWLPRRGSFP